MKYYLTTSIVLCLFTALAPVATQTAQAVPTAKTNKVTKSKPVRTPPKVLRQTKSTYKIANTKKRTDRIAKNRKVERTSTKPRGLRVRFADGNPAIAGRQGITGRRWSMETNPLTVRPNRSAKRKTLSGAKGKRKRTKSAKNGPSAPRASRRSVASMRLDRLRLTKQGSLVPQAQTIPRGAGAQGMAYRALRNTPTAPATQPPQPRRTFRTWLFGKPRTLKSASRS